MKIIIIEKNLFGKAITDCYHKKQKNSFYVCDEKGEYPLNLKFYISDKLEPHEVKILKYVHGKILEIGCGAGRILKYLQKQGYDTLGFDIDRAAVQLCKEQEIKNVFVESYVNIKRFGIFDTILALNRTIGVAGNLAEIKKLLHDCNSCCSKNGILIFDSLEVNPELSGRTSGVFERKLRYKYKNKYGAWFPWINFSSDVAKKILNDTGWLVEKIVRHKDIYYLLCRKK